MEPKPKDESWGAWAVGLFVAAMVALRAMLNREPAPPPQEPAPVVVQSPSVPTPIPAETPIQYDYFLCWGEWVNDHGTWKKQMTDRTTGQRYRHPGYFVARLHKGTTPDPNGEFVTIDAATTGLVSVEWQAGPFPNEAEAWKAKPQKNH